MIVTMEMLISQDLSIQYLQHGGIPERGQTLILSVLGSNAFLNFIFQTLKKLISLRRTI